MKPPPTPPTGHPAPGEEDPAARVARLTALALGELAPAEAGALEAEIWRDAGARREVESIRGLAEQLTFAYAAEPPTTLTPAQHRTILERSTRLTGTDEKEGRLTAYALGELRPSQAEVLSARLTEDRAATLELEAVGALAARLRAAFSEEPVLLLTLEQRQAIFEYGQQRTWDLVAPAAVAPASATPTRRRLPATRAVPPPSPRTAPASARPRRWLRTAALAAGFAALGYLASTRDQQPAGTVAVKPAESFPTAQDSDFFPPHPPASNPGSPQWVALLDLEKRRPSAAPTLSGTLASAAHTASTVPTPPTPAEVASTSGANPVPAPRRPPDASALPPPRKTLARGSGTDAAPDNSTVLHSPLVPVGTTPLAGFLATADVATATLPTDLGRAGYDIVRQCIRDFGTLPPADLVRPEEIINQFDYDIHPAPSKDFAVAIEAAACPWNKSHHLVRVTVAARAGEPISPPLRLTVFVRLAESPESERAQLLAWQGLQALASRLRPADSISLVVWGRARGMVLPPTSVADLENLRDAPTRWHQGGTVLGPTDWATAEQSLLLQAADNSRNLCLVVTDGPLDFSGLALNEATRRLHTMGAEIAVAELGPLRPESRTAALADLAAAPYFRADSGPEAARLLAQEALATRVPVAEEVDLHVVFNPSALVAWRPIGFAAAGHAISATAVNGRRTPWTAGRQLTALYEVVPASSPAIFAAPASPGTAAPTLIESAPPLSVRLRYRAPGTGTIQSITTDWTASAGAWRAASPDFRLAAGAAAFALRLQDDHALQNIPLARLREWIRLAAATRDDFGLRREFVGMLDAVDQLEKMD